MSSNSIKATKIVRILGGLGNQMFQYAFAISLSQNLNEEVKIDHRAFNGYPLHDGYMLDSIFKQSLKDASFKEVIKCNYPINNYKFWQICRHILPHHPKVFFEKEDMIYDKEAMLSRKSYYDGYWQSEKYFLANEHKVRKEFEFPSLEGKNLSLMLSLNGKRTASIHVRRGDYLNHPLFKDLTDYDYYQRGIRRLNELSDVDTFLIFSNDIEWCRRNLAELLEEKEIIFVDWNTGKDSFRDMQLMSLCNHNITANSSFSWWGAWLNPHEDKIVICPKKWMNVDRNLDIMPESWIKV